MQINTKRYGILDRIEKPSDMKDMSYDNLSELCASIREFIVDNVSQTGGHLSSNLGIVELSVAIHKVFDTSKDRIIFDVGHQSYVHKILTGRKNEFHTLRTFGGLSGFTKPSESIHDACISGHASTSVSTALGMAHARTIKKKNYNVVAVIGDGALTGGMAYEALNNAGASGEPLIVILNDNNMSIAKNVGAISKHLAKLRVTSPYLRIKKRVKGIILFLPFGKRISRMLTKLKSAIKSILLPSSMFEQMGFAYLGPVDGHNIKAVCELLELAKQLQKPTLIHAMTQKGKGYIYSEKSPDKYHGVSKFDVSTGLPINQSETNFSSVFGKEMIRFAQDDTRICAVTAAMQSGTGLTEFAGKFPERFFDVGIAEEHAVTMSAGMAKQGLKPVCTLYSTFLQRAFDQLIHDVAIDEIDILFAIDRAGVVGEDGATHNGVFDVGFVRQIPGFTLLAPSNFAELSSMMTEGLYKIHGPVAIRFPRGTEGKFISDTSADLCAHIVSGDNITIVSYGVLINETLAAAKNLANNNISCDIFKINNLSAPFTGELLRSIKRTGRLVVAEDVVHRGSVGQSLLERLSEEKISVKYVKLLNTGDKFLPHGSVKQLYRLCEIDSIGIEAVCLEAQNIE